MTVRTLARTFRRTMSQAIDLAHPAFPSSTAVAGNIVAWPGVTHESTAAVRDLLEQNDRRFHIWMKTTYFHNHLPHHLLTAYSLGAPKAHLQAIFDAVKDDMAPLDPNARKTTDKTKTPDKIDVNSWRDARWLGSKDAYGAYLAFFHEEIERLGPVEAMRHYVFSPEANDGGLGNKVGPRMLLRLCAGAYHPIIHAGFGLEFKDRVVLAEGLAEAITHSPDLSASLFPDHWPQAHVKALDKAKEALPTVKLTHDTRSNWDKESKQLHRGPAKGISLLELYAELCADPQLKPETYDPDKLINDRIKGSIENGRGERLRELVAKYDVDNAELEEIAVFATLLACSTGLRGNKPKVDFFLMHTLTSSIFLFSYVPLLTLSEKRVLLETYLLVTLQLTLSRGRPLIDLKRIMQAPAFPMPPNAGKDVGKKLEIVGDPFSVGGTNPWPAIVESAMYAEDSHVVKAIRSLVHHTTLYGALRPGEIYGAFRDGKPVMPGADALDGTIFVRGAGLIMEALGWAREGEKAGHWDLSALGYDESCK